MPKLETISLAQLSEEMKDSDINHETEQIDLAPIVQELKALVEKKTDNTEIIEKINDLIAAVEHMSITVEPTDLKPILDMVRLIKREPVPPVVVQHTAVAYKAVVHRDQRHVIETVDFIPLVEGEKI